MAKWSRQRLSQTTTLSHFLYDGNTSQSLESTSTGRSRTSVKSQLKRGVSNVKTIFHIGDHHSAGDAQVIPDLLPPNPMHAPAVNLLGNDSNTTTIHQPLKLRLMGMNDIIESDRCRLRHQSAEPSPEVHVPNNVEESAELLQSDRLRAQAVPQDQPVPSLQRRLSQRLLSAFNNGPSTVVVRPEMRSRPSVQTFAVDNHSPASAVDSSTPSTLNSGSSSTHGRAAATVTPQTSEPVTPTSIRPYGSAQSFDTERQHCVDDRILTPIPEAVVVETATIKTAETAASAKLFLETYFNSLFQAGPTRSLRRQKLQAMLRDLGLSIDEEYKARKAWDREESKALRQARLLKNTQVFARATRGLTPCGFETVKVLGKGSFGVVRLIKTKCAKPESATVTFADHRTFLPRLNKLRGANKSRTEVFAMKIIRKSDMIRNGQEGHLRAERDLLVAAEESTWIVPLVAAFQDHKHLYLVLEYSLGGDFLGLLIRKNILSEDVTRFYISEMILCVEEAHSMGWIHRDVKPDNFLIGKDGHLKISDFGLAFDGHWWHDQSFYHDHRQPLLDHLKIRIDGDDQDIKEKREFEERQSAVRPNKQERRAWKNSVFSKDQPILGEPILDWRNRCQRRRLARSVVGTSQYMAPEVVRGELYDGRCDWWSVAIIMYECLYGFTPFACENRQDTKLKILQHKRTLQFPDMAHSVQPSAEAKDLMKSILVEKERRLSCHQYESNDYTRKIVGGRIMRQAADKTHSNYKGYFVFSNDAHDIKAHPWFCPRSATYAHVSLTWWDILATKRPPFIPHVRDYLDTRYFDDEGPVSDIDTASTTDTHPPGDTRRMGVPRREPKVNFSLRQSQHQQEQQNIIPSGALTLPSKADLTPNVQYAKHGAPDELHNPRHSPRENPLEVDHHERPNVTFVDFGDQVDGPPENTVGGVEVLKVVKREVKRPKDIVLRDASAGKQALKIRQQNAFMGYDYRRPPKVEEFVENMILTI
ncbi:hypothetical protein B0A52_10176 [Exophiala mesophila]|uniref:non-specific serine/threonine protein kinase n=1 Tax=Exophiala mesophila TaxID=212818 RepID=A0A438MTJ5_EXOME|nr:hypothetical protein B0A52_10176 [Exophiala mesophila]